MIYRQYQRLPSQGFSLFEVLVVMAFLAILTGIVTLNFDKLIPAAQEKPLERVFVETVQDARIQAVTSGNPVLMSYDEETEKFKLVERTRPEPVVDDEDGFGPQPVTSPRPQQASIGFRNSDKVEVFFYPKLSQPGGLSASGNEFAREPAEYLVFHPSGAATPANVVIRRSNADDFEFLLDAFSSGPLEDKEDYR
ncbi:prepilin-type N-terminal cleavage/methylation domain-containing protein [Rubellicoccus peritrichatus]|uniref:Prepilin-type N-terminal cleavage/methylation domain-containing protein n=1 Tax=Rubellicoccus peritrichatus TaxID=3080537 RepID=A0AAQ3LDG2_9BACT|nr:prepilin-type N-terminal cleavage/methylation domain-containing protein [Puniceicoccus sp. CR14]WOO40039.1 prepilin-type N-terminal cleavage/methylation domain-containing protein [Puniceicoccus sp. CR14]